jgi:hypothetical protein
MKRYLATPAAIFFVICQSLAFSAETYSDKQKLFNNASPLPITDIPEFGVIAVEAISTFSAVVEPSDTDRLIIQPRMRSDVSTGPAIP